MSWTSNITNDHFFGKKNQTSILKMPTKLNSKCYVCTKDVNLMGISVTETILPFSKVTIPQKIGQLVGNNFVIIVSVTDIICFECYKLFNELDQLEKQYNHKMTQVINSLKQTYKLSDQLISANLPSINSSQDCTDKINSQNKSLEPKADFERKEEIEQQLSEMFGSPVTLSSNNKDKTISKKSNDLIKANNETFRCPICAINIGSRIQVFSHLKNNHLKLNKCKICKSSFSSANQLKNHIFTKHKNEASFSKVMKFTKKYKCAVCSKLTISKKMLNAHLQKHRSTYFKCGICSEVFNVKEALMKHLKSDCSGKQSEATVNEENIEEQLNESQVVDNSNTEWEEGSKEIKFLDCTPSALSYIDNETYSFHIKDKENMDLNNQKKDDDLVNNIDVEKLFEKLHSDSLDTSKKLEENTENPIILDEQPSTVDEPKLNEIEVENKNLLVYKCPGCDNIYSNSEQAQIHMISTGHGDLNTALEIFQFQESSEEYTPKNVSNEDTNVVQLISIDNETLKNDSIKVTTSQNLLDNAEAIKYSAVDPHIIDSNVQYIIDDDHTEDKFISFRPKFDEVIKTCNQNFTGVEFNRIFTTVPITSTCSIIGGPKVQIFETIDIKTKGQQLNLEDISSIKIINPQQKKSTKSTSLLKNNIIASPKNDSYVKDNMKNVLFQPNVPFKNSKDLSCTSYINNSDAETWAVNETETNSKILELTTSASASVDLPTSNTDTIFECKICSKHFDTKTLLTRHNNKFHRKPVCSYCNKRLKNLQSLRIHEQQHVKAGDSYVCDYCGKKFKTRSGLYNHRPVHTGNYNFFCKFCNNGFMSRAGLEEHIVKHTKEERFVCDICGKKFKFKGTYWIHRKWHDNPFPYKCSYCNRKFRHSSLLAVHKRKHTGERPYKCSYCKQSFSVGGTLKRHIILHTGMYPYICELCQRGFTSKHKFAVHLAKTHNDSKLLNTAPENRNYKMVVKDNLNDVDSTFELVSFDIMQQDNTEILLNASPTLMC